VPMRIHQSLLNNRFIMFALDECQDFVVFPISSSLMNHKLPLFDLAFVPFNLFLLLIESVASIIVD